MGVEDAEPLVAAAPREESVCGEHDRVQAQILLLTTATPQASGRETRDAGQAV